MPAHRKRSDETDSAFFAKLARGERVSVACRVTGCSRQALYRRRIKDLVFDRLWRESEAQALLLKRQRLAKRRPGYSLAVFAPRGRKGHKRALSDGLLLARLKALRPVYRD